MQLRSTEVLALQSFCFAKKDPENSGIRPLFDGMREDMRSDISETIAETVGKTWSASHLGPPRKKIPESQHLHS